MESALEKYIIPESALCVRWVHAWPKVHPSTKVGENQFSIFNLLCVILLENAQTNPTNRHW